MKNPQSASACCRGEASNARWWGVGAGEGEHSSSIGFWGTNVGFVLWGIPGLRGNSPEQLSQQQDTVPGQVQGVWKQRG